MHLERSRTTSYCLHAGFQIEGQFHAAFPSTGELPTYRVNPATELNFNFAALAVVTSTGSGEPFARGVRSTRVLGSSASGKSPATFESAHST